MDASVLLHVDAVVHLITDLARMSAQVYILAAMPPCKKTHQEAKSRLSSFHHGYHHNDR